MIGAESLGAGLELQQFDHASSDGIRGLEVREGDLGRKALIEKGFESLGSEFGQLGIDVVHTKANMVKSFAVFAQMLGVCSLACDHFDEFDLHGPRMSDGHLQGAVGQLSADGAIGQFVLTDLKGTE